MKPTKFNLALSQKLEGISNKIGRCLNAIENSKRYAIEALNDEDYLTAISHLKYCQTLKEERLPELENMATEILNAQF